MPDKEGTKAKVAQNIVNGADVPTELDYVWDEAQRGQIGVMTHEIVEKASKILSEDEGFKQEALTSISDAEAEAIYQRGVNDIHEAYKSQLELHFGEWQGREIASDLRGNMEKFNEFGRKIQAVIKVKNYIEETI